jgi:hypothetical protein
MKGRIGLGVATLVLNGLTLIGWGANATPIPGTAQQVGNWIVQANDDGSGGGSGKFASCDATRADALGTLVSIGQTLSGSWQIGFTNVGWQFPVGQDIAVTLFIDRVPYPLVLRTQSPTSFSTVLPDTTLVNALSQGNMLTLQQGGMFTNFSLDGSAAAINSTGLCQQGYAASVAPAPAAAAAAQPTAAATAAPAAAPAPQPAVPVPALPPAPAAGMPPQVAEEIFNLQSNCQVMNKTPPPVGDYVTRIGLTGSGIDDWLINTGGIACAGYTSGAGGGSMVEIFVGLPNGQARKVFARYALGVEIRGSTVWLGSSGDQCRGAAATPPATATRCQVPLIWNKAAQRFDEGPPANLR